VGIHLKVAPTRNLAVVANPRGSDTFLDGINAGSSQRPPSADPVCNRLNW
jgi:hypothetical protein